jgi:soluble lytic murein transglycosylase
MRFYFALSLIACFWMQPAAFAASHAQNMFRAIDDGKHDLAVSHARKTSDATLLRFAYWAKLTDENANADNVKFSHLIRLTEQMRDWPKHNRIRLLIEKRAFGHPVSARNMKIFCKTFPPISGYGMFACVRAKVVSKSTRAKYIAQGWMQGDFNKQDEAFILKTFKSQLNYADHYSRMDRLLFEGKHNAAKRLMRWMRADDKPLFEARISLRSGARDANAKLKRVSHSRYNDPGLIFDRMQWRHKKGLTKGVIEMLLAAPKNPPYADLWWSFRARYAREALALGKTAQAIEILANIGDVARGSKAEALWLQGWITLEHQKNPKKAYESFYALFSKVGYPVSKARAAFWAAEASRRNGNNAIAREWYKKASRYGMVFYGQLAQAILQKNTPLFIGSVTQAHLPSRRAIEKDPTLKIISLLGKYGQKKTLDKFLLHAAAQTDDARRLSALTALAGKVGQQDHQVRTAKYALRKHVLLLKQGWPMISLPKNLAIEPALTLAITRQESEFNRLAKSGANARGLMQLLPRTAREIARRIHMRYQRNRLWEAAYNVTLGSAYLGRLIAAYDGALVPAIAAYNAGSGNVRKWLKTNGSPGKSFAQTLFWIESIPFSETRNYVQRVLENLQIYRTRKNPKTPNQILSDLKGA